ncbi:hypothetical protein D3C76_784630 [compost metagenome]
MDGSRAIGMFNCSDDDWQLGKDSGLLTFDRSPSAQSLLLYFRHFDGGYRLYLRSGEHLGEGVFTNANGLITVQPITASDPSLWSIIDAQTGQPFDLTQCEGPVVISSLQAPTGTQSKLITSTQSAHSWLVMPPPIKVT